MSDSEKLREQLKDYYGTAMFSGNPMAVIDLARVESASDEELENLAQNVVLNNGNPFGF